MERKTILNDLEVLNEAYIDYKNSLVHTIPDNLENEMDYVPKKPDIEKPKEPVGYSLNEWGKENQQEIDSGKLQTFKEYVKEQKSFSHDTFKHKMDLWWNVDFKKWEKIFAVLCLVLSIVLGIVAANIESDLLKIVAIVSLVAGLATIPADLLIRCLKRQIKYKNDYKSRLKSIKSVRNRYKNIENDSDKQKVFAEYEKENKIYWDAVHKYEEEYKFQEGIARKKIEAKNNAADVEAKKKFNSIVSGLSIEYPERYYEDIKSIARIIEDCRADAIKEAINVMIDDRYREEQRRQAAREREEREAAEREAETERKIREISEREERKRGQFEQEQAERAREREEKQRINEARLQCVTCKRGNFGNYCPMKGKITTVCPNYISY